MITNETPSTAESSSIIELAWINSELQTQRPGERMNWKNLPVRAAIAALLNFFIWGVGYLYIGKRRLFAILLLAAEVFFIGLGTILHSPLGPVTAGLPVLIVSLALAYDAFRLVK